MRNVTVRVLASDPGTGALPPARPDVSALTPDGKAPPDVLWVPWQLRELRAAVRAGNVLDALTAAARIHAAAVRPNMRRGRWPRAQAACEQLLDLIPARRTPGYLPRLRRVIEFVHADAACAARASGDLQRAKRHLIALTGYLSDRRAPVAQHAVVLVDLARVYIAADEPRAGERILAAIGPFLPQSKVSPGAPRGTGQPPHWRRGKHPHRGDARHGTARE